jgi:hypothetical protein
VSNATWSPDSTLIAFYVHTPDATHIWVADTATGVSQQLTSRPVLATLVSSFDFSADGRTLATVVIPDGRPQMPAPPASPTGPQVKVADDADKNRLRTFPSLMATAYDFELLEWHAMGQVVVLDVQAPAMKAVKARPSKNAPPTGMMKIGQPQMVRSLALSPDGKYLRVTRMTKPFSYVVPASNVGSVDEVWDLDGKVMVELDKRPLNEGVQDDTAPPPDPGDTAAAPTGAAGGRGGRGGAGSGKGGQQPRRPDRLYQWLLDVAVPVRQQPFGGAVDVPRPRGPERRHGPDEFHAAVPRTQRTREDDGALPLSAGGSRAGDEGDSARLVGPMGRVAGQVRENPEKGDKK